MARRNPVVVALAACAMSFSGCRNEVPGPPPAAAGIAASLCAAADAASNGRTAEARAAFDDAHGALHDLAARAERADRTAAADLLEAKQRVEASPTAGPADYRALVAAAGRAMEATGDGELVCADG